MFLSVDGRLSQLLSVWFTSETDLDSEIISTDETSGVVADMLVLGGRFCEKARKENKTFKKRYNQNLNAN